MTEDRLLTAREAAEAVSLSIAGLWRAVSAGRLPCPVYPLPKSPRWRESELLAAVEATRALPREQMARRRAAKLNAA